MLGSGISTLLVELFVLTNMAIILIATWLIRAWRWNIPLNDKLDKTVVVMLVGVRLMHYQITAIVPALYAYSVHQLLLGLAFTAYVLFKAVDLSRDRRR